MADDSEFITRLIGFGFSEREARLYFHLLKYGPKSISLLAKSLKTYQEDVHRMLAELINKGVVSSSLETPTVYTAVDLDVALDVALKKRESELRELERKKQELQEISKQQGFSPSDEFPTFKIIKSIKEFVAISIPLVTSSKEQILFVVPRDAVIISSLYGVIKAAKMFIERGGTIRGICDISLPIVELTQGILDIGVDIRHYDQYRGIYFAVADRKTCISVVNVDIRRVSLDEPVTMLWTDDTTYAYYLTSTFELLWVQSIPAAQRIEELLKEGLSNV